MPLTKQLKLTKQKKLVLVKEEFLLLRKIRLKNRSLTSFYVHGWKKKNYGPAALFTVVLLGMAFLAGNSYASYGRTAPTASLSATTPTDPMYWDGFGQEIETLDVLPMPPRRSNEDGTIIPE